MRRVLLAGAGGQLGWELQQSCPENVQLSAYSSAELDIRDAAAIVRIAEELKPDTIINAAAYTAVDKAESEAELAYAVNADGAANLALAAKACDARLIQVSTDYVFDGTSSTPYLPESEAAPLGVYGESKLQGERRVQEILPQHSLILRTSWVYSSHGNNFVKSMLRLMSEREELGVVADQVGTPTYARYLAKTVWAFCESPQLHGIYHWSDAGVASWYDFAVAIMEEAQFYGLLDKPVAVNAIRSGDYPTAAKRPNYTVLDKYSTQQAVSRQPQHWRVALREMLFELTEQAR